MARDDIICWLDLETTGSDLERNAILEVGIAITTHDLSLTILREFTAVHKPAYWEAIFKKRMDPVVVKMHTDSGLLTEVEAAEHHSYASDQFDGLERDIQAFLGPGTEHIPLAGSGVSHFDRQFIRRDLINLNRRLSYWAYDVGVLRRFMRLAGRNFPPPKTGLTHRALQDVRDHIAEARQYMQHLDHHDARGCFTCSPVTADEIGYPEFETQK